MKRAVVVLLLLIANAIVSSSRMAPATSAPVERFHSLGLFTILDGASLEHSGPGCAATERLAWSTEPAGETPAGRTGEDACVPDFGL